MHRDTPAIETEDDLRGKDIIVIRGDIMHDYVLESGLGDNPVPADGAADALQQLFSEGLAALGETGAHRNISTTGGSTSWSPETSP